jgi:hypothetical protein
MKADFPGFEFAFLQKRALYWRKIASTRGNYIRP